MSVGCPKNNVRSGCSGSVDSPPSSWPVPLVNPASNPSLSKSSISPSVANVDSIVTGLLFIEPREESSVTFEVATVGRGRNCPVTGSCPCLKVTPLLPG